MVMEIKTIKKTIEKLEKYIEYASHLPVECMDVGMVVKVVLARDSLVKGLEFKESCLGEGE